MHRRTLLATLPAAIALTGCVDVADTPPDDEEHQGDDRDVEDRNGDVEVTVEDTTPDDVTLEFEVEVVQGAITDEAPPTIEVEVFNVGDKPVILRTGTHLFMPHSIAGETDEQPVLLGFEDTPEYDKDTDCWRAPGVRYFHGNRWLVLEPGESDGITKALATREDTDGCYPAGTYRFEDSYEVEDIDEGTSDDQPRPGQPIAEFTWGFELEIHG